MAANVLAYWQTAQRTGAEVVVVPNDCHGQLDTTALAELMDERVKLIGVSHVPPAEAWSTRLRKSAASPATPGVLFLLDATQSVGQFPVDVDAIGCDLRESTGVPALRIVNIPAE
jgi:selenocysteine lyase/cysteine desulfurase